MKLLLENWRKHLKETIGGEDNPDLFQDPDGFETAKKPIPLEFRFRRCRPNNRKPKKVQYGHRPVMLL